VSIREGEEHGVAFTMVRSRCMHSSISYGVEAA
jgi:hypothetical protein